MTPPRDEALDDSGELRPDPRLIRMLAYAPDADVRPTAATSAAIRRAAREAVASAPAAAAAAASQEQARKHGGRWRWLGGGSPRTRAPWHAAFATVLVAFFITLLWRGEPVSESTLDAPATEPVPAAAPPAAVDRAAKRDEVVQQPPAIVPRSAEPAAARSRMSAATEARSANEGREGLAAPAAPAPSAADAAWRDWTHLRISPASPVAAPARRVGRMEAPALAEALQAVMPATVAAPSDAALPAAVDWRLTLEAEGRVLGTLELGGDALRWQANGAAPVFATPAPAALRRLREALSSASAAPR